MTAAGTHDAKWAAPADLEAAASSPALLTAVLELTGMHCASCAALIESSLGVHPGVESVKVDLERARATIVFDSGATQVEEICGVIAGAGYGASVGDVSAGVDSADAGSAGEPAT
jgi:copper chaperone CopZ